MTYSSNEELQAAAEHLKTLLGHSDWTIKARLVDELDGAWAQIRPFINKRWAMIDVLSEKAQAQYLADNPDHLFDRSEVDQEYSLIHEITHLSFVDLEPLFEDNKLAESIVERNVHFIATAVKNLLTAARRARTASEASESHLADSVSGDETNNT